MLNSNCKEIAVDEIGEVINNSNCENLNYSHSGRKNHCTHKVGNWVDCKSIVYVKGLSEVIEKGFPKSCFLCN